MLNTQRFILLFLVLYFNRTVSHDGNSFQWKINVAIRSFAVFSCAALLLLCSARHFLLWSARSCFLFFTIYFFKHSVCSLLCLIFLPSALPSVCSALILFTLPSFVYLLCSSCSVLPALLDWGGRLPFFDKNHFFIPPPENSRHFFKSFTILYT